MPAEVIPTCRFPIARVILLGSAANVMDLALDPLFNKSQTRFPGIVLWRKLATSSQLGSKQTLLRRQDIWSMQMDTRVGLIVRAMHIISIRRNFFNIIFSPSDFLFLVILKPIVVCRKCTWKTWSLRITV